jgi:hypothetical protein
MEEAVPTERKKFHVFDDENKNQREISDKALSKMVDMWTKENEPKFVHPYGWEMTHTSISKKIEETKNLLFLDASPLSQETISNLQKELSSGTFTVSEMLEGSTKTRLKEIPCENIVLFITYRTQGLGL